MTTPLGFDVLKGILHRRIAPLDIIGFNQS